VVSILAPEPTLETVTVASCCEQKQIGPEAEKWLLQAKAHQAASNTISVFCGKRALHSGMQSNMGVYLRWEVQA